MTRQTKDDNNEWQTRLAELEREKEALLKVVSHDLRSPFNKLFALIGLLRLEADTLTGEQKGYLDKMELVINDALGRIHNLLELRTLESQGFTVHPEEQPVSRLVRKALADFSAQAKRKNITLTCEESDITFVTDRLLFQRITGHLIANAIKFTPPGKTVKVWVHREGGELQVCVRDGGYGIAPEEQPQLYQKFKTLSPRPTAGESATGLGLYLAAEMARMLGGRLSYSNKDGSVFCLHLPEPAA